MKLLSFDGGVTVQGGLPIPVATPAHGTTFDIAGKNLVSVTSRQNAFDIACTMSERSILARNAGWKGVIWRIVYLGKLRWERGQWLRCLRVARISHWERTHDSFCSSLRTRFVHSGISAYFR